MNYTTPGGANGQAIKWSIALLLLVPSFASGQQIDERSLLIQLRDHVRQVWNVDQISYVHPGSLRVVAGEPLYGDKAEHFVEPRNRGRIAALAGIKGLAVCPIEPLGTGCDYDLATMVAVSRPVVRHDGTIDVMYSLRRQFESYNAVATVVVRLTRNSGGWVVSNHRILSQGHTSK